MIRQRLERHLRRRREKPKKNMVCGDADISILCVLLSEMVDSDGNYVRIQESPSGNSKNGLPMGPENQQGRNYAGPEGLSEGSNPATKAAPMPLLIICYPTEREMSIKNSGVDGMKGVSAAERGFTDWKGEYYDQLTDENTQSDRPGDVRRDCLTPW